MDSTALAATSVPIFTLALIHTISFRWGSGRMDSTAGCFAKNTISGGATCAICREGLRQGYVMAHPDPLCHCLTHCLTGSLHSLHSLHSLTTTLTLIDSRFMMSKKTGGSNLGIVTTVPPRRSAEFITTTMPYMWKKGNRPSTCWRHG